MSGAPDFVGLTINAIHDIVEAIIDFVLPPPIRQFIKEIKEALWDFVLVHTIGLTVDQIKDYFKSPEFYFDRLMGPNSIGGQVTSLRDMNSRELHLSDPGYSNPNEHWDYHKIPAAYNTVTMS